MKLIYSTIFLLSLVFLTCTSNPFFEDEQQTFDRHNVSGNIRLQDGMSPEDAYIWIEDLNVSAFSAENGNFTLRLPNTTDFQGINGIYSIFLYMGNYEYASANALIRDGLFEYGQQDISNDGKLTDISPLSKILTITTTISPEQLTIDETETLTVRLNIDNIDSGVSVRTYKDRDNRLAGIFVKEADAANQTAQGILLDSYRPVTETITTPTLIETGILWDGRHLQPGSITLSAGEYEIFPFIYIHQEGLPSEIIASFGEDAERFSTAYLSIPFKQTTGRLTILD